MQVEIFDELGESMTLVGATNHINASGNPLWFGRKFDELSERIRNDIRAAITVKHGDGPKDGR